MRIRQSLALLAENLSGLRSFGNLQLFLALQSRNLDHLAQRGLRKTDRNFADQIRTAALEECMLFHVQKNVKVARRAAVDSRLALSGHSQTRARIHSSRNANLQYTLALDASLTGARKRDREKSLRVGHLPAPATSAARGHARPRLGASSLADLAQFVPRQIDLTGNACRGFFETESHIVAKIRATLPARASAAGAASPATENFVEAEEVAKDVLKFLENRGVESGIETAITQTRRAKTVVDRAFLRIRKNRIGFRSRAKVVLGF